MNYNAALLSLRGVSKSYGAVNAITGVDLDIFAGQTVALCGDNGAGKSSLIKIISGAEQASSGQMALHGKPVKFTSPHDALENGVATIYQDLALAPRLSVYENIFMGSELTRPVIGNFLKLLDRKRMRREARDYLKTLSPGITDMAAPVERLSGGQRQAVAIGRALRWQASLIIMDEPTAALGVKETAHVLDLIRMLKAQKHTIILISHSMRDVAAVADRIVILSAGRKIHDASVGDQTADALSHLILERSASAGNA